MVKPSGGLLSGRTKRLKGKGRVSVAQRVRTFKLGSKVVLAPRCDYSGLPHLRYAGRHGIIVEGRGKSYMVEIRDGGKTKRLVVSPIHMKLAG